MIFDCFAFFNELEILDIRLHELSPIVDKFVLVEAHHTFQGNRKPLYYDENKNLFKKFHDKIIHVPFEFPENINNLFSRTKDSTWAREYHQRDRIGLGLTTARPDDLIIVSDVDEIPSAAKLAEAIRRRRRHELTVFTMPNYIHYINRRHKRAKNWYLGPRMIEFSHFTTGQKMRMTKLHASRAFGQTPPGRLHTRLWNYVNCGIGSRVIEIENAGWHLSSIGGWQVYRNKIMAFSHAEMKDTLPFSDEDAYFGMIDFATVECDLSELPKFVQDNHHRYAMYPRDKEKERLAARTPGADLAATG